MTYLQMVEIVGYLGTTDHADVALCRFARAYADQTDRDDEGLVRAIAAGSIPADHGIC